MMNRKVTATALLSTALILILVIVPLFAQALPIPGFNQAYRDSHGYWGAYPMGTNGCPDRIETAGCLITSLAAVLDYYGIKLTIPAAESDTGKVRTGMDPGILNDWLRAHGGYGRCATDRVGKCCLEWTAIPWITLSGHTNSATTGLDSTSRSLIDSALAHGYPVIAGVHWGAHCHGTTAKTENCHWVVITGVVGTTYTITDPYNRDVHDPRGIRTTLNRGVFGAYTIDRFVVATGPVPTHPTEAVHLSFAPVPVHNEVAVILSATTGGKYLVFVQVVGPDGTVYYARRPNAASLTMQLSPGKASLIAGPLDIVPGKNVIGWLDTHAGPSGTYTILVQLEDPQRPGTRVATAIAAVSAQTHIVAYTGGGWEEVAVAVGIAVLISLATALIVLAVKQ